MAKTYIIRLEVPVKATSRAAAESVARRLEAQANHDDLMWMYWGDQYAAPRTRTRRDGEARVEVATR